MTLFPITCNLSLETVLKHLNLIEEVPDTVQPFQYEVIKNDTSVYFIKIFLQRPIVQPSVLNVTLSHLNGTMIVPQNFTPTEFERNEQDQIIEIVQISLAVLIGGSIMGTIALGASSIVWALVSYQQFVGYFIYINVLYPSQVETFLLMLQVSFWDYLPNPLAFVTEPLLKDLLENNKIESPKFHPPQKFMIYEKTSFFIENGGSIIITNIMLLIFLAVILNLKSLKRFQNRIFLKYLKVYLRWNVVTRTFLENGLPLGLAICLQLRIFIFDGPYLITCAVFTVISMLYMAIMISFMLRILYKRDNDLLKKGLIKRIYGTLHEGVILKKSTSKYFHIVILFRGLLLVCLISFFEDSPLIQIIPLIFFNVGLIYYMIREVPFEDKKFDVITKIKEVFILFGEIGIMMLVTKIENETHYEVVGWFIVVMLGCAFFIESGYVIILQIVEIKQIINHYMKMWKSFFAYLKSFCSSSAESELPEITTTRKKLKLPAPQKIRISSR